MKAKDWVVGTKVWNRKDWKMHGTIVSVNSMQGDCVVIVEWDDEKLGHVNADDLSILSTKNYELTELQVKILTRSLIHVVNVSGANDCFDNEEEYLEALRMIDNEKPFTLKWRKSCQQNG